LDISANALEIAKQNAILNNVNVEFFQFDILSHNSTSPSPFLKFDIIVSNPPYIRISEKAKIQKNVLEYEPHLALFVDDTEPLLFYIAIADFALKYLNPNGKLYLEINETFGQKTKQMLESKGFKNAFLLKDLNNKNRILSCNI
jgi:release factor glutamine methyltransferase